MDHDLTSPGACIAARQRLEDRLTRDVDDFVLIFLEGVKQDAGEAAALESLFAAGGRTPDPFAFTNVRKRWMDGLRALADRREGDPATAEVVKLLQDADLPSEVFEDVSDLLRRAREGKWTEYRTKWHLSRLLVPKQIKGEERSVYRTRVRRLARTAATRTYNSLATAEMAKRGFAMKRWVTRHDAKVRHTHALADGQTVGLDQSFNVGKYTLVIPGDPLGPLDEIANCRCVVVAVPGPLTASGALLCGCELCTVEIENPDAFLSREVKNRWEDDPSDALPAVEESENEMDLEYVTAMVASGACTPCELAAQSAKYANEPEQIELIPEFAGVLGVEGELTGDGRLIEVDALSWETPMPLRLVSSDLGAHAGAVVVGSITTAERLTLEEVNEKLAELERDPIEADADTRFIWGTGDFDLGSDIGREGCRLVQEQRVNGVSMDLDNVVFESRATKDGDEITATTEGRVRAGTIVAIPAFTKAQLFTVEGSSAEFESFVDEATDEDELAALSDEEFNWVEDVGGLPRYIKRISKHLRRKGMREGHAIAVAVNVVKKMCATGDLNYPGRQDANPISRAKACAAVAHWERMKIQAKANSANTHTLSDSPVEWEHGDTNLQGVRQDPTDHGLPNARQERRGGTENVQGLEVQGVHPLADQSVQEGAIGTRSGVEGQGRGAALGLEVRGEGSPIEAPDGRGGPVRHLRRSDEEDGGGSLSLHRGGQRPAVREVQHGAGSGGSRRGETASSDRLSAEVGEAKKARARADAGETEKYTGSRYVESEHPRGHDGTWVDKDKLGEDHEFSINRGKAADMTQQLTVRAAQLFRYNPLQWRNPRNGKWIDMPGSALKRFLFSDLEMTHRDTNIRVDTPLSPNAHTKNYWGAEKVLRDTSKSLETLDPKSPEFRSEIGRARGAAASMRDMLSKDDLALTTSSGMGMPNDDDIENFRDEATELLDELIGKLDEADQVDWETMPDAVPEEEQINNDFDAPEMEPPTGPLKTAVTDAFEGLGGHRLPLDSGVRAAFLEATRRAVEADRLPDGPEHDAKVGEVIDALEKAKRSLYGDSLLQPDQENWYNKRMPRIEALIDELSSPAAGVSKREAGIRDTPNGFIMGDVEEADLTPEGDGAPPHAELVYELEELLDELSQPGVPPTLAGYLAQIVRDYAEDPVRMAQELEQYLKKYGDRFPSNIVEEILQVAERLKEFNAKALAEQIDRDRVASIPEGSLGGFEEADRPLFDPSGDAHGMGPGAGPGSGPSGEPPHAGLVYRIEDLIEELDSLDGIDPTIIGQLESLVRRYADNPAALASAVGEFLDKNEKRFPSYVVEELNEIISQLNEDYSAKALVASGAPTKPPKAWFTPPRMTGPTPLTVTKDGRVYGHLATWDSCHLANPEGPHVCTSAPRSSTDYAYFHMGAVYTAEGSEVAVGHITLDTGHAGPKLNPQATLAHYDNTGTVVADVRAGEDEFGIWVAGALRPGLSEKQLRALRSAPLSGDWRRVRGNLELVAALAVNMPAFPVPRPVGMVASGAMQSLVASGMVAPKKVPRPGSKYALTDDDLRWLKQLAAREREAAAEKERHDRLQGLAARVNSLRPSKSEIDEDQYPDKEK